MQTVPAAIFDEQEERGAVPRPRMTGCRPVEPGRQTARSTAATVEKRKPALIVERALDVVRIPDDVMAVGRIARVCIGKAAVRGQRSMPAGRDADRDDVAFVH